jgi:hypothetical protein
MDIAASNLTGKAGAKSSAKKVCIQLHEGMDDFAIGRISVES